MTGPAAHPFHAHVYYDRDERGDAQALHAALLRRDEPLFVGRMTDGPVGPHPIPQFEQSGLRILVHPLTDDDVADHTSLGRWIGKPVELDVSVLDPPGQNQGVARFGLTDF